VRELIEYVLVVPAEDNAIVIMLPSVIEIALNANSHLFLYWVIMIKLHQRAEEF